MRLVLDMQGAQTQSRFRGIGRYSMSFARAVVRNRGEHEVILALNGMLAESIDYIRDAFDDVLTQDKILVWHAPGPVGEIDCGCEGRRSAAEVMREAFLASLRPDVIHLTSLFEGYEDDAVTSIGRFDLATPVCVTLYDLIPWLNPDDYLRPNPSYARYYARKFACLKRAWRCLAISEHTQKEGERHLGLPAQSIVNVSCGLDSCFQSDGRTEVTPDFLRRRFKIVRPFVLYTGGSDHRKNLPGLLEAYSAMPKRLRTACQLVMAGKMAAGDVDRLVVHARSLGLGPDDLIFTGYVDDKDLVQLYQLCQLFVFPSKHEGFGLPALEAMACGAAVIGSNTSSLPEVIGLEEALFDPFATPTITAKMVQVLENKEFAGRLRNNALRQSKYFSWDKTACSAWEVFASVHAEAGRRCGRISSAGEIVQRLMNAVALACAQQDDAEIDSAAVARDIARNHPSLRRKRKLFIDISELVLRDAQTGIQRVVRSLLKALTMGQWDEFESVPVYSHPGSGRYLQANVFMKAFLSEWRDKDQDWPLEAQNGDVFLGLDLQPQIVSECRDYYRFLRRQGVWVYFVVYDLLPLSMPDAFPPGMGEKHRRWLDVVAEADGAVAISRAVAEEVKASVGTREANSRAFATRWFHLGSDLEQSMPTTGVPESGQALLQDMLRRPTFLMVGTIEPRKGYGQVVAAFEKLWNQGLDVALVVVGKRGWNIEALAKKLVTHKEKGARFFWLDGASDEYLEQLYARAVCLIAASWGEGFGLPLVEAARRRVPLIVRELPVFREVAGSHAFYFSGPSPDDLAACLEKWLELRSCGQIPSSSGLCWLTWSQSANQLVDALFGSESLSGSDCDTSPPYDLHDIRTRKTRPNVLILCPYPILRPRHGGQLRSAALRQVFEKAGFATLAIGFYQAEAYEPSDLTATDIAFPVGSPFRLFQGKLLPGLSDYCMSAFALEAPGVFASVSALIRERVDSIVVEQPWFFPLAQRLKREVPFCRDAVLVFSSQNIEGPMKEKMLQGAIDEATVRVAVAAITELEIFAAREADLCLAVTKEDADVLRDFGAANILVAPNGIRPWRKDSRRMAYWRERLPRQPWPIYIASAHPPNFTGFTGCVGDALGCIPPGSRLVVAGGVGEHLRRQLQASEWWRVNSDRLQILGVLDDEDLAAVKSLAHAFLLPIGAGGGSNIKTAEALYSGKPVICTTTALRGFEDFAHAPEVTVAETPAQFQAALRTVLISDYDNERIAHGEAVRAQLTWDARLRSVPAEVWRLIVGQRGGR